MNRELEIKRDLLARECSDALAKQIEYLIEAKADWLGISLEELAKTHVLVYTKDSLLPKIKEKKNGN